jgi:hypothetical protein
MDKKDLRIIFWLIGFIYIIYTLYQCWIIIDNNYANNRIANSISAFWSQKNFPKFNTEQGPIYLTYYNPCYKKEINTTLSDFYIFSVFKPYQVAGHSYDVCSLKGIKLALDKGARFHYLDIWSSNPQNNLDNQAYPIVRNKTLMPKYGKALLFSDVCKTYKNNSWLDNNYPLLIYLNIQSSAEKNKFVLRKIAKIIWENFQGKFVPSKYSFAKNNIGSIPMSEAMGKIIIFTSIHPNDGYLQEITNGIINEKIQNSGTLFKYGKGHQNYGGVKSKTSNLESIVDYNRTHIGMVIPEEKIMLTNFVEPGTDLYQIPFDDPMKYGYQAVFINLQKPGKKRDDYINFFKRRSFILKEDGLRHIPCPKPDIVKQNKKADYSPRSINVHKGFFEHNF